ncbi:hypothetical protein [Enterobacter hormaechei]|uniref:hypothetical protein n=1 Tax=Enterobacter hormaechei TaxID=158836 RepID=UPI000797D5C9|nr:hypothetical protein [Enterobacter hormaechei]CZU17199.1 Uncharacterised protein [Enterobacter hormaechei]CZU19894.1 Uncharacterised protein [Enterobacter hormaechei]CZU31253.1 Uncharacterised protein [Enterobacter hormaechei]CZU32433.1 Uncharacterised protein [Enterobacter hormaechei]CZY33415.1 Uncharacterised protein [Enterobacter hormaechei]
MKERGMIFNVEMVSAILDGRKTQTRRIMKVQPDEDGLAKVINGPWVDTSERIYRCPFGVPGDRIWVRETFQGPLFDFEQMEAYQEDSSKFKKPEFCVYKADGKPAPEFFDADDNLHCGWRPSIHMPRWASRITLEITGVRVERLNSISQEDAQAEGMELTGWRPTYSDPDSGGEVWTPYDNFAQLWESIYGEENWQANPWVWVIEFKVASPGGE